MATARAKATKSSPYQPFIDALNKKQHELLDSYERDKAAGNQLPDDGIQDLADKAASAYSKELNFSLSDGERNLLMLIEEAFNRIREGNYAVCTNCSNQIGEKRLGAVPWTPYCIDCQELQEKGLLA
jgi:RNA polymerase-binding transcription factor